MIPIYTLTPNPGLDHTLFVDQIDFNAVLRAAAVQHDWGGKGFNVARALRVLGMDSVVVAFMGGPTGQRMASGLHDLGIRTEFVAIQAETRTNTVIQELSSGRYVKVNEPGPIIQPDEIEELYHRIETLAQPGSAWVLAGSLARGLPDDFYACVIARLKERGAQVCLDASGQALRYGCLAQPYLVKPNADEAAELTGLPVASPRQAVEAARSILSMGIERVAISLGELGLLLADARMAVLAAPPAVPVKGVTGAGDSSMAGLVWALARQMDLPGMARAGAALGTASVMNAGVAQINLADFHQVYAAVQVSEL